MTDRWTNLVVQRQTRRCLPARDRQSVLLVVSVRRARMQALCGRCRRARRGARCLRCPQGESEGKYDGCLFVPSHHRFSLISVKTTAACPPNNSSWRRQRINSLILTAISKVPFDIPNGQQTALRNPRWTDCFISPLGTRSFRENGRPKVKHDTSKQRYARAAIRHASPVIKQSKRRSYETQLIQP